ncbi:hypothetical protein [Psychrobacillus sp. OK032]|uniref:hypothetical protein n=1 Tax=Psychrobacillus sp. OK032 TaxID=1884358 RepID=UPI0008B1C1D6|nr:hypothetical protein [Psychrobacillus sp. OK032]SES44622.1 hypothetical protein SAMN05518872_1159 [Psychrobacillus sp. OK032]
MNNSEINEGLNIEPNYQVELTNSEGGFFLLLDEKQGKLVRENDDEISYILSKKSVKVLNGLLK